MQTLRSMCDIMTKDGAATEPSDSELRKIPKLFARIKDLLKVYYQHQVFRDNHPNLKLCDLPEPAIASYYLYLAGSILLRHETHLRRLATLEPTLFESIFFDVGQQAPQVDMAWDHYTKGRKPNQRPEPKDRTELMRVVGTLSAYRLTYQTMWFLAPIWLRLSTDFDGLFPHLVELATSTYVKNTCDLYAAFFHGTSAIQVLLSAPRKAGSLTAFSPDWMRYWVKAGGLPSLLNGALMMDGHATFHLFADAADIAREMLPISEVDAERMMTLVQHQIDRNLTHSSEHVDTAMRTALFLVLDRPRGLSIFIDKANGIWFNSKLIYFSSHLFRNAHKYQTQEAFDRLWERQKTRWDAQTEAMRRYLIELYEPWQVTEKTLEDTGCMNRSCPETRELRSLMKRLKGRALLSWSPADLEVFQAWGRNLKVCKSCRDAVYCSRSCQAADWRRHRPSCRNKRTRRK